MELIITSFDNRIQNIRAKKTFLQESLIPCISKYFSRQRIFLAIRIKSPLQVDNTLLNNPFYFKTS